MYDRYLPFNSIAGFIGIGKRRIDFVAVQKTERKCRGHILEGIAFDSDVKEATVKTISLDGEGNTEEVIVVGFQESPEVLILGYVIDKKG